MLADQVYPAGRPKNTDAIRRSVEPLEGVDHRVLPFSSLAARQASSSMKIPKISMTIPV